MITESIIAGGQIRPDIEDESRDDEAKRPECREKTAESARQRCAAGQRRSVEKCDESETQQRQPDEREIDPEQSSNQSRKRRKMSAQVYRSWHCRSSPDQSEMERASDLEERGEFHGFRSEGADLAEKGQDDMAGKHQPKRACFLGTDSSFKNAPASMPGHASR